MKVHYKTVWIPHLNYQIRFRRLKRLPTNPRAEAYVRRTGKGCDVFLKERTHPSTVAHELVHVLQYIAQHYHMQFEEESEHMAYLMQWLMGEVMGHIWK